MMGSAYHERISQERSWRYERSNVGRKEGQLAGCKLEEWQRG
jgi:hypothetical protein